MSDRILTAIARQEAACTLHALRTFAEREGMWRDEIHMKPFEAKREVLEGRWK